MMWTWRPSGRNRTSFLHLSLFAQPGVVVNDEDDDGDGDDVEDIDDDDQAAPSLTVCPLAHPVLVEGSIDHRSIHLWLPLPSISLIAWYNYHCSIIFIFILIIIVIFIIIIVIVDHPFIHLWLPALHLKKYQKYSKQ